jgi:hypothetical protein
VALRGLEVEAADPGEAVGGRPLRVGPSTQQAAAAGVARATACGVPAELSRGAMSDFAATDFQLPI